MGIKVAEPEIRKIDIKAWLSGYLLRPNSESYAKLHVINVGSVAAYDVRIGFVPS